MYADKDTVFKQIGAKVAYYRNIRHLTQKELAILAHVSVSSIGRIERGRYNHNVPMSILIDIANGLGIDISLLVTFEEKEKKIWWEEENKIVK
ncbi:MAG: helix-turn-helix domain-containing protein [Megasphaera sp.]|nr:helix-turn-helix domain-containing protein [Megasphaera sp.]